MQEMLMQSYREGSQKAAVGSEELKKMKDTGQEIVWLIALILASILTLGGCKKTDTYRPYYYPDKHDLTKHIRGPDFSSLESARRWVYQLNEQRGDQQWDYEIGKNPKRSKYGDVEICEETLQ